MFSDAIGRRLDVGGRECLEVGPGETGHGVYGPYQHVRPGRYRVDFELASTAEASDERPCATIDVSASRGAATLASRDIRLSELNGEPRLFSLEFDLHEFRALEFRVHVAGAARLRLFQPTIALLGSARSDMPPADPNQDTRDPVELHHQIRAVLRLLRPCKAAGLSKIRLGHAGDGGYVCLDDFADLDIALSLGINDDVSWDLEAADRGLSIEQFDHTVDDPAPHDTRMTFHRKKVAAALSHDSVNLTELVRRHDKGKRAPNLILKMDIEGAEWEVLAATSAEDLSRFSQILCELHYFQGLEDTAYRKLIYASLQKLNTNFAVIHVHANVCGGISNIANVIFPNVLEISFANRNLYRFEETDELFPTSLDTSCDVYEPDMYLGAFRY